MSLGIFKIFKLLNNLVLYFDGIIYFLLHFRNQFFLLCYFIGVILMVLVFSHSNFLLLSFWKCHLSLINITMSLLIDVFFLKCHHLSICHLLMIFLVKLLLSLHCFRSSYFQSILSFFKLLLFESLLLLHLGFLHLTNLFFFLLLLQPLSCYLCSRFILLLVRISCCMSLRVEHNVSLRFQIRCTIFVLGASNCISFEFLLQQLLF